jgi:MYXO-CTERM domain-containing protein
MTWRSMVLATAAMVGGPLVPGARADSAPPSQLELAAMPAIKLGVRGAGWIRVSQPTLLAAGLDPAVDPGRLRLFADGIEQSIRVTGNGDSTFDAGEAIEFYGVGRDTLWTDIRTYWLIEGAPGAVGQPLPLVANTRGSAPPPNFPSSVLLQQRETYYAPILNGDATNFFGDVVDSGGVAEMLTVNHVDSSQPATLQVVLQGVTTGTHRVAVAYNGLALGTCVFGSQDLQACPFALPAAVEGPNQVTLLAGGDDPDYSLVDTVEIDYAHLFTADGDVLNLTAPPSAQIAIGGFSTPDARIVDVTDPDSPIELVTGVVAAGSAYVTSTATPSDTQARALYAFTDAQVGAPVSVAASRPSAWAGSAGAEMVILSNAQFIGAVAPLAARRTSEGWSVDVIDLQDVYDEFGAGDETVFAIRDFLQYAHQTWSVPPRFVLLVGDASFDPRNFLGLGDFDFAPTKLIDTAEMETASDDWFVDWNSDGVPDIAIGRFSVRTAAEATTMVGKVLAYQGAANLPQGALFVADQSEDGGLDFEGASRASEATVSGTMPIDSFFLSQPTSTPTALIAALNQGPFLVNYMGHGSVEVWDELFSDDDATALTNQPLSIYVSMNCLNGFFHDVYTESLAEALTKAPAGGAIAAWASSTLTAFDPQTTLNQEFLKRLTHTSLGEAAMAAKAAITDIDAQRTWILFGDPTLFGTPGSQGGGLPPTSDGGAPDAARDGATRDATADAPSQSGLDARNPDGPRAGNDGSRPDGPAVDGAGGCSCRMAPSGGPETGLLGLGVVMLGLAGRRRSRRRAQGSGEER